MKEVTFIRHNIDKWKSMELTLETVDTQSPDTLADLYTELTADLAFAQTHYPSSRITLYLNNMAYALHGSIYKNKREKWSRLITFWTHEVPLTMYEARKYMLISLLVFLAGIAIGVISTMGDAEFPRIILGDNYVDMTLENIRQGHPMAVYDGTPEDMMFFGITIHNVMVSFQIFAFGLLTCFGTGIFLLYNGIMVGAFETFFYQHELLGESALAIFLHGTLELSAIVISGSAGFALGWGWLFPGTYSRGESFRRGARQGLRIIVGVVPVFIVAGFIESIITRHTEIHDAIRLSIILCSLAFVLFYYIYLPKKRYLHANEQTKSAALREERLRTEI